MKAIFYSTIRAFGRREAELITPKRLRLCQCNKIPKLFDFKPKRDFCRNPQI